MAWEWKRSALVLIDLQQGIVEMAGGQEIVKQAVRLVRRFRQENALIAFVRVSFIDGRDALRPMTDAEMPATAAPAPGWDTLVPELAVGERDYVVTKRQWGAFFGTDLDLQLRRRGIGTIVLGGISTNIGVETTAREAFQLGYQQIFITDAMKAATLDEHEATCRYIFPRIGKLRTTDEWLKERSEG